MKINTTIIIAILLVTIALVTTDQAAYAHHKDGHDKGPPDDKGKPDDVPKGPPDKVIKNTKTGGSCSRDSIGVTSSERWAERPRNMGWSRCMILDDTPPQIQEDFVTPSGRYYCAKVTDDVGVKTVVVNGKLVNRWAGSYNYYCETTQYLNDGEIRYGTTSTITRDSQSVVTYSKMQDDKVFKMWSIIAIDMGWNVDYKTFEKMYKK